MKTEKVKYKEEIKARKSLLSRSGKINALGNWK